MDTNTDLFKNLTAEDLEKLGGLFEKVMNTPVDPEQLEKEAYAQSENQYAALFKENDSLLDSPVEMVFTVVCNVYTKNQKGEVDNSEKVLVKNYHVPLNNKQQVERYIEGFFNKFHDRMEKQAQETVTEPSNEQ